MVELGAGTWNGKVKACKGYVNAKSMRTVADGIRPCCYHLSAHACGFNLPFLNFKIDYQQQGR